jgi:hypothetical protein
MPQNEQDVASNHKIKDEPIRDKSPFTTITKKRKGGVAQNVESPSKKAKTMSDGDRKTGAWSKAEDKIL